MAQNKDLHFMVKFPKGHVSDEILVKYRTNVSHKIFPSNLISIEKNDVEDYLKANIGVTGEIIEWSKWEAYLDHRIADEDEEYDYIYMIVNILHKYLLKENGIHVIGSHFEHLDDTIADEELHEYRIVDRDTEIENLCMWITEAKDNATKVLMKKDLKKLLNIEDDYILSSNSTNSYIHSGSDEFNKICGELIELNNELKKD